MQARGRKHRFGRRFRAPIDSAPGADTMSIAYTAPRPLAVITAEYLRKYTGRRNATRSGSVHRTGAPVRRDSLEAGTFEDGFFVEPAAGEPDRMLMIGRAAEREARHLRRKRRAGEHLTKRERSIADLTAAAIDVYEEICMLARVCKGKVYPSYEHFVDKLGVARRTVARVLPLLEAAGLLIKKRRFERVKAEGAGPRYQQTSNAYRPLLAEKLLSLLPRWARPAPTPPDVVQREAERQEEQVAMLSQLSCRDLARATLSGPMADVMARIGAAIDLREREC
jgi:DNA-binding transcriptional regulator YhcF (GntR family)